MNIVDDVGVGVSDGQMAVHPLLVLNAVVDHVGVRAENNASVTVLGDVLVGVLQILTNQRPNSSAGMADEYQDCRFV